MLARNSRSKRLSACIDLCPLLMHAAVASRLTSMSRWSYPNKTSLIPAHQRAGHPGDRGQDGNMDKGSCHSRLSSSEAPAAAGARVNQRSFANDLDFVRSFSILTVLCSPFRRGASIQ
ncbi:hypothetical protein LZ31DRAFT_236292 [Colletotrichum somersetense]|nr:hypothetical protein LZ31DRAFT_236292 [Colletotrichum somersetense]